MASSSPVRKAQEAAQCNSCMGLAYYSRALNDKGKPARCVGFSQAEQGDVDSSDIRSLTPQTRDFKYYCLGYSNHTATDPARPGEHIDMPYCEGIEVVVMEEEDQRAHVEAGASGHHHHHIPEGVLASELTPAPTRRGTESHAAAGSSSGLPAQHASTSSSSSAASSSFPDPNSGAANDLRTRFVQRWHRNLDALRSVSAGEKELPLPVQLRKLEGGVAELPQHFAATLHANVGRMQAAAGLLGSLVYDRTLDALQNALKPVVSRLRSEEPEEEEGSS